MEYLSELTKCKGQIERELRLVGHNRGRPYPKRLKISNNTTIRGKDFEYKLHRLKYKWGSVMDCIFHAISDRGTYDKIAFDLMKSFNTFYTNYAFDGDQLFDAFKCILIPVIGQILDEDELGKNSRERQDRRKYFLRKMLSSELPEANYAQAGRNTPSLDGSIDVCSESPTRGFGSSRASYPKDEAPRLRPSPLTIRILDLLVEAIGRHSKQITGDKFSMRERIHHVTNILSVVEMLRGYFGCINLQFEVDDQICYPRESCFDLLSKALERYERQLGEYLDLFTVSNPMYLFKEQTDLLHFQVKQLRSLLRH